MTLETVESDVLHAVGYDAGLQILELIFNNGSIYQYRGVPPQVYRELLQAASKGSYFQNNIRDEFEYWQWDGSMAKFIRAAKSADEKLQGATE